MKQIEESEVAKAIWILNLDKVPGPDDFTMHFY